LLKQAVDELMLGAAGVPTALLRASDHWFQRCSGLVSDVSQLLEREPGAERIEIGVSLLAQVVSVIDEASEALDRTIGTFLEPLRTSTPGEPADSSAAVSDAEQSARALLTARAPSMKYASRTPAELCELYLAAGSGD
jgi:hypothetical protein